MTLLVIPASAIVNKMEDLEIIEEKFNKNVGTIDKEFLKLLKNPQGKNTEELEKDYRLKLREAVSSYEQELNEFLIKNKKTADDFKDVGRILSKEEEEEDENALDMSKPFEARHLEMKHTKKEIDRMKKEIKKFKKKIEYSNFFRKHLPSSSVKEYFRLRLFYKRLKVNLSDLVFRVKTGTLRDFDELKRILGGFFNKVLTFMKNLSGKISGFVKSKILKKKEEIKEKSNDEKIAEKLLSKKS